MRPIVPVFEPMPLSSSTGARRVLVVDDEPLVRRLVRRILEREGYVVEEAVDGEGTLSWFAGAAADVLLLDLSLPDMDGMDVVRSLRLAGVSTPVVLMSGFARAADRDQAEDLRLAGYLRKPFTIPELAAVLDSVFAR